MPGPFVDRRRFSFAPDVRAPARHGVDPGRAFRRRRTEPKSGEALREQRPSINVRSEQSRKLSRKTFRKTFRSWVPSRRYSF